MALAEAIAHGLPVVSTMAGAIPDTVPAGTGLLVPPNDGVALAQALRRLIGDRAERQRLAMNARAAAAQFPHLAQFRPAVCRRNRDGRTMSRRTKAGLPGERAQVAVERALAEFRSGRPVLITSASDAVTATA